jgi:D-alanyl-D-alanine carboxypeptidase
VTVGRTLARRAGLVTIALLAAAVVAAPSAGAAPVDRKLNRLLDRIVDAKGGPPGLSVLMRTGQGRQFLARGTANVKTGRRPTPHDHMRIASVAKAYNGAVTLALVERGFVSLDDTLGEWIPELLPNATSATVGQVLHHTGGLPEYIESNGFAEFINRDPRAYVSPEELLGWVRDEQLDFPPGSKYHYSDTDNIAAGVVAARAAGISYDRLLQRYIYRPLGLKNTTLPVTVEMPKPYLHGYDLEPNKPPEDVSELINPAGAWASGGIVSTPADLGRFIRAYVGARLFSPATRRLQREFVSGESSPPGAGENDAGLGVFRYRTDCGTVFGHTGSFPGYRMFAASNGNGLKSVVFAVNSQIVPGQRSSAVSNLIRKAQRLAVCKILGD